MHCATVESRHVLTPAFLSAVFLYPFVVLKCRRVTGLVRADNLSMQQFGEHLGLRREGVMREGATDGTDFVFYGLLRSECRFLHGRYFQALQKELGLPITNARPVRGVDLRTP
jgi:hypothetical protein